MKSTIGQLPRCVFFWLNLTKMSKEGTVHNNDISGGTRLQLVNKHSGFYLPIIARSSEAGIHQILKNNRRTMRGLTASSPSINHLGPRDVLKHLCSALPQTKPFWIDRKMHLVATSHKNNFLRSISNCVWIRTIFQSWLVCLRNVFRINAYKFSSSIQVTLLDLYQ